jgi:hypothetical protein
MSFAGEALVYDLVVPFLWAAHLIFRPDLRGMASVRDLLFLSRGPLANQSACDVSKGKK